MAPNITKLKKALEDWLARNHLDGDTHFYTSSEWKARDEEYLDDARLVLVFEGGLYLLMNGFMRAPDLYEEFVDLVNSFGYWYELGEAWNMGFYPTDGYGYGSVAGEYRQKLQDERWKKKSDFIRKRAGNRCEDCGKLSANLEVHHCYYVYGFEPWEYPYDALRCLCPKCHDERPKEEIRLRGIAARWRTSDLARLRTGLEHAFCWFQKDYVLEFLLALGPHDQETRRALELLLLHKAEQD